MKRPNVVICGGLGYVGSRLATYLADKGFDCFVVGRGRYPMKMPHPNVYTLPPADLLNYSECESVVKDAFWVFNLAADVGGIGHIQTHKAAGYASATINTNLLRAIVNTKTNVKGYFLASSSCVYGGDNRPEGSAEGDASFSTASAGYGQAKYFSEQTCLAFKQEYGIPVRIARYHSVYGPGENRPGKEHFIESLVNKVVEAKLSGNHEIKIWGDGEQKRSLLYIDDCLEGTYRIMAGECSEPINLAHRDPITVNQVVSTLEHFAGIKLARFYNYTAPTGIKNKTANVEKCESLFGWTPPMYNSEGLEKVWNHALYARQS